MKKYILLSLTMLLSISMYAQQQKKLVITTKNNDIITYIKGENVDSFRVIPEIGIKVYPKGTTISEDYLYSQITYEWVSIPTEVDPINLNKNTVVNDQGRGYRFDRLELPKVSLAENDFFIQKYDEEDLNFTVEWCGNKRANRWTAYQICATHLQNGGVKRRNKFIEDPEIPEAFRTTNADYPGGGYARGHLLPSGDRVNTQNANDQTFYFSNMQPQISGHNSGIWNTLEGKVRKWAALCDTMYVVKAATIDKEEMIQGYITNNMIVPKYFYMALLAYQKSTNTYTALGVWSPHYNKSTPEYISIEELEQRTGIDFFCNLPDELEERIEQNTDPAFWEVTISDKVGVDPNEEFPPLP